MTKFDFQPLDHADLGEKLDIIDVKKAAQISGSLLWLFQRPRCCFGNGMAMFYAFQKLIKKGFVGMIPPSMVKSSSEWKCGYASNKNLF